MMSILTNQPGNRHKTASRTTEYIIAQNRLDCKGFTLRNSRLAHKDFNFSRPLSERGDIQIDAPADRFVGKGEVAEPDLERFDRGPQEDADAEERRLGDLDTAVFLDVETASGQADRLPDAAVEEGRVAQRGGGVELPGRELLEPVDVGARNGAEVADVELE